MNLRELTKDLHDSAEKTLFAQKLINGITPVEYALYLKNQYIQYSCLEDKANQYKLFEEFPDIQRTPRIIKDYFELSIISPRLSTADAYCEYINRLDDPIRIMAHVYVRHFGDLYGGQILKKRVPGNGTMYNFKDRKDLIKKVREKLDVSMADEARVCYQYAIDMFVELQEYTEGESLKGTRVRVLRGEGG